MAGGALTVYMVDLLVVYVMALKALCRLSGCGVYCKVVLQIVPDFLCVGWRIEGASLSCD